VSQGHGFKAAPLTGAFCHRPIDWPAVRVAAGRLLHPQSALASVSRQMLCLSSSSAMQAPQPDTVMTHGTCGRTCTPLYVCVWSSAFQYDRSVLQCSPAMLQCCALTFSLRQLDSELQNRHAHQSMMFSSGVMAEADGRAAASGGWGATVALALEADQPFDARRQLHSGAAASSPAAGAHLPPFPHSCFCVSRGLFGP
jgi:hypothetical protein